jgi:hypothetical protein
MRISAMDQAVRRFADRQCGMFSAIQAHSAGASPKVIKWRVETGTWERVTRGVYRLPGAPDTWKQRLWIALLVAGPCAAVAREAAAALWGIPGFPEGPVEIVAAHGMKDHRLRYGKFHETRRLPSSHVTIVDGIPVTTLERTLFDLAGAVNEKRADRAIENVLARRHTTVERLWGVWADIAAPHRPGTRVMRKLLIKRGPAYVARESELEIRFTELLDAYGIAQPSWQVDIGDDDFIGRVDCLFRRARLIVELDGRIGHVGPLDEARDAARDKRLRALGYRVRRFTWADVVLRPRWVISELQQELRAAA